MRKKYPGTTQQASVKGKVLARIWANGKSKKLGWFEDPAEAYRAYREAKAKYQGIMLPELAEGADGE